MNKAIKISEWLIFLSLLAVLVVLLSPILPVKKFISSFVVVSGSMEPSIKKGSLVFIKPVEVSDIVEGDVIGFISPLNGKDLIIHRVVRFDESTQSFITKGDNNSGEDNWQVYPLQIKGKMVYSLPFFGYVTSFMKTPKGFSLLIGLPAVILVVMQIKKIKDGIDEEVSRRTQKVLEQQGLTNSIT